MKYTTIKPSEWTPETKAALPNGNPIDETENLTALAAAFQKAHEPPPVSDSDICKKLKNRYVHILENSKIPLHHAVIYNDSEAKRMLKSLYPDRDTCDAHNQFIIRKICKSESPLILQKGLSSLGLHGVHDERPRFQSFNAAVIYVMQQHRATTLTWDEFWTAIMELNAVPCKVREYFVQGDIDSLLTNLRGVSNTVFKLSKKKDFVTLRPSFRHLITQSNEETN